MRHERIYRIVYDQSNRMGSHPCTFTTHEVAAILDALRDPRLQLPTLAVDERNKPVFAASNPKMVAVLPEGLKLTIYP